MVSPFLAPADSNNVREANPLWDPEYGQAPLFPLWPRTLYERRLGFGADTPDISAEHVGDQNNDTIAGELLIHHIWDFLNPADRELFVSLSPAIMFYHKLRKRTVQGFPIHDCRKLTAAPHEDGISHRKAMQMAMALLRANFVYPDMFRWLGGEYNNKHRDLESTFNLIARLEDHDVPKGYPPIDTERAWRLCTEGAPLVGHFKCSRESVRHRNMHDNLEGIREALDQIMAKFVKEERFGYHIFFPRVIWRFIPGIALALINWVPPKPHRIGDSGRLVIDPSSTVNELDDGNANKHIPDTGIDHDQNPSVAYGTAFLRFLQFIFNLRIDHPSEEIYLSADDISAAFRRVLYNPNAAIVFASVLTKYLIIPAGGIFGSKSSPGFYMIFGELRAHIARHIGSYTNARTELASKIHLTPPPTRKEIREFARVTKDALNSGCATLLQVSPEDALKAVFAPFVDDTPAAGTAQVIATRINESVLGSFFMFSFPDEDPCRSDPINPLKFQFLVSWALKFLGYILNTRDLTITWPAQKQLQLRVYVDAILNAKSTDSGGRRITPQLSSRVLGLVRHGAVTNMIGIYFSLALQYGLSDEIRAKTSKSYRADPRSFWRRHYYNISRETVQELKILRALLPKTEKDKPNPIWTRKIGLIIPREPVQTVRGDASLEGLGGWSLGHVNYMWRIPTDVLTIIGFKVPKTGWEANKVASQVTTEANININILEFMVMIIDLWLTVKLWKELPPSATKPCELILAMETDNTSALSWAEKAARVSVPRIRRIARLYQSLLTHSPVPLKLQTAHIAGKENHNADILSRPTSEASSWASVIEQSNPSLERAMPYQIPSELLSTISKVLKSEWTGERIAATTTHLWTLEPRIFTGGCETWESTPNTFTSSNKRRGKRSRSSRCT